MNINLADSEAALLRDVLENTISDLGMEIAGTDTQDYRVRLKERREVLQKVLAAVKEPTRR